ncbi:hypothetical protein [Kitasatospora sp. McL0602]
MGRHTADHLGVPPDGRSRAARARRRATRQAEQLRATPAHSPNDAPPGSA